MGTPGSIEMRTHWCRRFIAALEDHGPHAVDHEEALAAYEVAGMLSPEDAAVLMIDLGVVQQQRAEASNEMRHQMPDATSGQARSA
jgi:hypothetical protein